MEEKPTLFTVCVLILITSTVSAIQFSLIKSDIGKLERKIHCVEREGTFHEEYFYDTYLRTEETCERDVSVCEIVVGEGSKKSCRIEKRTAKWNDKWGWVVGGQIDKF